MSNRILTGIKPTGTIHLGNYFGTFEPALRLASEYDDAFWFVANYHALNQIQDKQTLEQNTLSTAAAWIAFGLDESKGHLYAQSDVPEVFELETILNSFTPKGWMNKAHAYKAAADQNNEANKPADDGISMGLYTYPVLMAADILIMNTNVVPVGKDQVQHVEIARDIALRINNQIGNELFVLPEHRIEDNVGTIPGIDGRKMSKSYDNVIPVFASPEERQQRINQIVTDSTAPEEAKQADGTALFDLYKLVTKEEQANEFKAELAAGGLGWGDAKQRLGDAMNEYFGSMTDLYNELMSNPDEIRNRLQAGAEQVRPVAQATIARVREAMGII